MRELIVPEEEEERAKTPELGQNQETNAEMNKTQPMGEAAGAIDMKEEGGLDADIASQGDAEGQPRLKAVDIESMSDLTVDRQ